jgi:peptidoglycan lytic transglycosylase
MKTILLPAIAAIALTLAGCASTPPAADGKPSIATTARNGGYYLDDGPEANPPPNLDSIPDAVPRNEPLNPLANRPYAALGTTYTPLTERRPYSEEGLASWYGRRFQGKRTSSGESYDMYAMTAAHPTLPIPSYARVTSISSGKSVVVRINDRGPFHSNRIIDVSYTAAYKLGLLTNGSGRVRVQSIDPDLSDIGGEALNNGVYLQVGAFAQVENARKLLERLQRTLEFDNAHARVVLIGSLHRVQIGPYAGEDDARADRERMRERLDLNAILVRRDRREDS